MGLSAPGPGPTKAHASEKEEITASLGESDLCCVSEWVKQLVCCWAAYGDAIGPWLGHCHLQEGQLAPSPPQAGIGRSVWTHNPKHPIKLPVRRLDFCLGLCPSRAPAWVRENRREGCPPNTNAARQQGATPRPCTRTGARGLESASMRPSPRGSVTHRIPAWGRGVAFSLNGNPGWLRGCILEARCDHRGPSGLHPCLV